MEAANPIDLIMRVCDQEASTKKKQCIETLKANPKTATAKDSKSLAETTVEMSKKQSTEASNFLKTMLAKPVDKDAINQCIKYFDDSVGMMNLGGLQDGTATLDVHYAYDNVGSCETALAKANVHVPEISAVIQKWREGFEVTMASVTVAENDNSDY
ncbi:hypothetical protein M5689_024077 [Euphorbia peplus]|nr:hypothetical protein M5689_024077 [Euphorbia peplus]